MNKEENQIIINQAKNIYKTKKEIEAARLKKEEGDLYLTILDKVKPYIDNLFEDIKQGSSYDKKMFLVNDLPAEDMKVAISAPNTYYVDVVAGSVTDLVMKAIEKLNIGKASCVWSAGTGECFLVIKI